MSVKNQARSLDVILTAGCNLSCSYCYQNAKQPARRMSWPTLRSAVDLLLASRRRSVTLGFYGGEPLLRFDMIRRAVRHAERRRPAGKQLRYAIITNGTLLGKEQAKFLAHHEFRTQISFDGVPAAQAERGGKTFHLLDALLSRLRRDHPLYFARNLHVSMTLLPRTVSHIADSVDYFIDKGVCGIRFSPQVGDTSSWRKERIDELDKQFRRVFRSCLAVYEETGEIPVEAFRRESEDDFHVPRARSVCGAPSGEGLAVDVDGVVNGCVMFAGSYQNLPSEFLRGQIEPLRMGEIGTEELKHGLRTYRRRARPSKIFHHKQDKYSSYARCADCRHFHQCTVCPVSIGAYPGNEDPNRVPDFVCAYNLVIWKYRGRFPRLPDALEIVQGKHFVPALMRELEVYADALRGAKE